jgi:hypothetical protein
MFFQKVLKGIAGLSRQDADATFLAGIQCNWWRKVRTISPEEIVQKLTADNLDWHLNHYADPDPRMNNAPFYENTPFISVTAGSVEREEFMLHVCDAWQDRCRTSDVANDRQGQKVA